MISSRALTLLMASLIAVASARPVDDRPPAPGPNPKTSSAAQPQPTGNGNITLSDISQQTFDLTRPYSIYPVLGIANGKVYPNYQLVNTDILVVPHGDGYDLKWTVDGGCNGWNNEDHTIGENKDCDKGWADDERTFHIMCVGPPNTPLDSVVCSMFHGPPSQGDCLVSTDKDVWTQGHGCRLQNPSNNQLYKFVAKV